MLEITTEDDEINELKYKTERHDHENFLKSLKNDNEYYKKKLKSLIKRRVLLIITEILLGSGSPITTSTMAIINLSIGTVLTSSTALVTSTAILITNEFISELKISYTKLGDWINFITLLYEKTLNESMIDKKLNEKEIEQLKQIYNQYIDKRSEMRKILNSKLKMFLVKLFQRFYFN